MAKQPLEIPFDPVTGNMQTYPTDRHSWEGTAHFVHGPIWTPNFTFNATLKFKEYTRGRSSVGFMFVDESTNHEYSMFVKEFTEIVPKLVNGTLTGTFTFVKRGANYGFKMF